jgi:hypothetical protein
MAAYAASVTITRRQAVERPGGSRDERIDAERRRACRDADADPALLRTQRQERVGVPRSKRLAIAR